MAIAASTDGTADPVPFAENGALLTFQPIDIEAVRPGMVLRLDPLREGDETVVSSVRVEHVSSVSAVLVADAVYRNAELGYIFQVYSVSALVPVQL